MSPAPLAAKVVYGVLAGIKPTLGSLNTINTQQQTQGARLIVAHDLLLGLAHTFASMGLLT
jgi:hypothetical protein